MRDEYTNRPKADNGRPMRPDARRHEESRQYLLRSDRAKDALRYYGIEDDEATHYGLGFLPDKDALTTPFFSESGKLEGVKWRFLDLPHTDKNRFKWGNLGKPPAAYVTSGCFDTDVVIVAEGPFKGMVLESLASLSVGFPPGASHSCVDVLPLP